MRDAVIRCVKDAMRKLGVGEGVKVSDEELVRLWWKFHTKTALNTMMEEELVREESKSDIE